MSQMRPLPELEQYRKNRGISREDLAKELAVTATTIWRWEAGTRRPDRQYAARIAEITGVPLAEIIGAAPAEAVE